MAILQEGVVAFIVEVKIGAALQDHQKPWHEKFDIDGYGAQIRREFASFPRKHYILLQNDAEEKINDRSASAVGQDPILCLSRTWADLLDFERKSSGIVRDLLDSLAEFNIPVLKTRILGGKRMKEHTNNTAAMYELLATIAKKYGFDPKAIDAGYGSSSAFGLEVPAVPPEGFSQLRAVVQNRGKLGWYGFESVNRENNRLSVWFYCGPGARPKAEEFVRQRLDRKSVV